MVKSVLVVLINLSAFPLIAGVPGKNEESGSRNKMVAENGNHILTSDFRVFMTHLGQILGSGQIPSSGIEYPAFSGKHILYSGGFGLSGFVDDSLRVSMNFNTTRLEHWNAGTITNGKPNDPLNPEFRIYKYTTGDQASTNLDTEHWPVQLGAEFFDNNKNGIYEPHSGELPRILGYEMLWMVINDMDNSIRTNWTKPLGIEIQISAFSASSDSGKQYQSVFLLYKLINKGGNFIDDMVFSAWSDPDIGLGSDDLTGSDSSRKIAYCYNGQNIDNVYGANSPAFGMNFLFTPMVTTDNKLDSVNLFGRIFQGVKNTGTHSILTTDANHIFLRDPKTPEECRLLQTGHQLDGFLVDPESEGVGANKNDNPLFLFSGIPENGTGWVDFRPADKRFLVNSNRFNMQPGDTQYVLVSYTIGQGNTHLESISNLRILSDSIKSLPNSRNVSELPYYHTGQLKLSIVDQFEKPLNSVSISVVKGSDVSLIESKSFYNLDNGEFKTWLAEGKYTCRGISFDEIWGYVPDTIDQVFHIVNDSITNLNFRFNKVIGYYDSFSGKFNKYWKVGAPGDTTILNPSLLNWSITDNQYGWPLNIPKGRYTTTVTAFLKYFDYPVLAFYANYRLSGIGDSLLISISGDNGLTWRNVGSIHSNNSNGMVPFQFDLEHIDSDVDSVKIRFTMVKNSGTVARLRIDNFSLNHNGYTSVRHENFTPLLSAIRNYPNPFNPVTIIEWQQAKPGDLGIIIYNILGQQVFNINTPTFHPGTNKYNLDLNSLSTGLYIYELYFGGKRFSGNKILFVK